MIAAILVRVSRREKGIVADIISTDEDPGLRIESFAKIKNTWCIYKVEITFFRHGNIQKNYSISFKLFNSRQPLRSSQHWCHLSRWSTARKLLLPWTYLR